VLGHTIFEENLSQDVQHNLICIQNLGNPEIEKLDMDWDSAHVHDLTSWFKSQSLVFPIPRANERSTIKTIMFESQKIFQDNFTKKNFPWQIIYMMQNLKWRTIWCPMASYVRWSTLKVLDGNISNVVFGYKAHSTLPRSMSWCSPQTKW
jgi:hypothetical protein